jgi:hypothetical protein
MQNILCKQAGFTPDDYYIDQGTESPDLMGETGRESSFLMPSSYDMDIYGEAPDKMISLVEKVYRYTPSTNTGKT